MASPEVEHIAGSSLLHAGPLGVETGCGEPGVRAYEAVAS